MSNITPYVFGEAQSPFVFGRNTESLGSEYVLNDIESVPVYAISFSRYLVEDYVGSPVIRVYHPSRGSFSFTVEDLQDGTAESIMGSFNFSSTGVYNQVDGSLFESTGNYACSYFDALTLPVDSNGKAALKGKASYVPRWKMATSPYSGTNGAIFEVVKMVSHASVRAGSIGWWSPSGQVLSQLSVIRNATYATFHANGVDGSGLTDLNSYENVESIFNMTGLDLSDSYWSGSTPALWPGHGLDARQMEQIYFNEFDASEREMIEADQRSFYGYF